MERSTSWFLTAPSNQPTTAQRRRSETEKVILDDLLSSEWPNFKKYHSFGNLKFIVFPKLKIANLTVLLSLISLQIIWAVINVGRYERTEPNLIHFKWEVT